MSAFTLVYTRAFPIPFYSDSVNIPYPNVVKQGTASGSISPQRLIIPSGNFDGIQIGDTVFNDSATMSAYVVGVENSTTLILSDDIFTSGGDSYTIYQGMNNGCYIYVPDYTAAAPGSGVIEVETIGGDIAIFVNPPAGVLPVQVVKVTTGTDIAKLVALW